LVRQLGIPGQIIEAAAAREQRELERREREYRDGRLPLDVRGRTVVLVDDGLATGASMRAAVEALRAKHPAQIIVAVPVAAPATCAEFEAEMDQVVCALTPQQFSAVGQWYQDFSPTTDEEVRELLRRAETFGQPKAA
jgi:predicted phosphoribosyltransferase